MKSVRVLVATGIWSGALFFQPIVRSAEWSDDVAQRMGLPVPAEGSSEIRVWVGGGVVRPFYLYRFRAMGPGVQGERVVWTEASHADDSHTERILERENRRILQLLRREYCGRSLQQKGDLAWCSSPPRGSTDWNAAFRDLQELDLSMLPPQESLGARPCDLFDGIGVGIETFWWGQRNHVVYWNPEQCCPWSECERAAEALKRVEQIR